MKKLFGLVAAALCVLAVTSCKLPETGSTSYTVEVYKYASAYDSSVQTCMQMCSIYSTETAINTAYASMKTFSFEVTSDRNASKTDLYNFLVSKGLSSSEANTAINNAPSIMTCTINDASYPKGWIYIYKN